MTIFGGYPAEEGVGMGTRKHGFLAICCKCGWHSTVTHHDGKLVCTREQCQNEADMNDHNGPRISRDHAVDNGIDILPEDSEGGC